MRLQRLFHPLEHFEVQGYSVFGSEPERCCFAEGLEPLSDSQLRSVSGNGMHAAAIGLCMMFLLSATRQATPPA
eukprot:6913591-Lingulodinium_polyedra.AAC.1